MDGSDSRSIGDLVPVALAEMDVPLPSAEQAADAVWADGSAPEAPAEVTIDLSQVTDSQSLHRLLQRELDFGPYYGRNWSAFRDMITASVALPQRVVFTGWARLEEALPEDASTMKRLLKDKNEMYGGSTEIIYR
ncbi:barstar family protein [Spirillospora sp. CA-142024]|uniref:barstar family protein n=1 Tax=Spirillospora sp. CA-142024 TaxID=3240036 RepID=UPI003D8C0038